MDFIRTLASPLNTIGTAWDALISVVFREIRVITQNDKSQYFPNYWKILAQGSVFLMLFAKLWLIF